MYIIKISFDSNESIEMPCTIKTDHNDINMNIIIGKTLFKIYNQIFKSNKWYNEIKIQFIKYPNKEMFNFKINYKDYIFLNSNNHSDILAMDGTIQILEKFVNEFKKISKYDIFLNKEGEINDVVINNQKVNIDFFKKNIYYNINNRDYRKIIMDDIFFIIEEDVII